jgi:hypothetical protein
VQFVRSKVGGVWAYIGAETRSLFEMRDQGLAKEVY